MWGRGGPGRISFPEIPLIPAPFGTLRMRAGIWRGSAYPWETPAFAGVSGGWRVGRLGPGFRRDDKGEGAAGVG